MLLWAMVIISLSACIGKGGANSKSEAVHLSEREEFRYNNAVAEIERVESLMQQCEQGGNVDSYASMLAQAKALRYEYNAEGMNEATIEYCNNLKLSDAKKLLLETDASVTEIALDVGFNDAAYFINLFRKSYGITPLQYRKASE